MAYKIFGKSATVWLFILPFFLTDFISNGEEIGWRGYVLPRLQAKYSALTATLILGVIWGFWHLPKYLTHFSVPSFAWFMGHTMAAAVLYTWLYNNTKGSLLLVTLFHASSNTMGIFMPMASTLFSENMGAYTGYVLFEVIVVVIVVLLTGSERISRTEEKQVLEESAEYKTEFVFEA
jgi:membrane protease YdiL (CAAX protease family)